MRTDSATERDERIASPRAVGRRSLYAWLHYERVRAARLRALRWLALVSVPLWVHALGLRLPAPAPVLSMMAQGVCAAIAAGRAALEGVWRRRAEHDREGADLHIYVFDSGSGRLRSLLWCVAGALGWIPSLSSLGALSIPPVVLMRLGVLWVIILLSVIAAEVRMLAPLPVQGAAGAAAESRERQGAPGIPGNRL